jgi:hypothetical protein
MISIVVDQFAESMSEVGNFLPIEALQYPQTYSANTNQRLKRTYGIKRDRNRKTDQVINVY